MTLNNNKKTNKKCMNSAGIHLDLLFPHENKQIFVAVMWMDGLKCKQAEVVTFTNDPDLLNISLKQEKGTESQTIES